MGVHNTNKTIRELVDMVFVRLEMLEKDVYEMTKSEGSRGKQISIERWIEEIRDILNEIRVRC